MKVIIAGGGTGGHIFPAIAIGQAIQRLNPSAELLFIGANGKMEMEKIPQAGYSIIGLDIVGFNRSNLLKNIWLPIKMWQSNKKAKSIIKRFRPNIVIGVGGYASFPILYAAQQCNIPTLIQEQNSFAGKTNKIIGKKANKVCVAYEGMEAFFSKEKIVFTGNPVRALIGKSIKTRSEGLNAFKLKEDKITLLIVGGSLGAVSINNAIAENLQQILQQNVQLIWQTGATFWEQAEGLVKDYGDQIVAKQFITNMDEAYAAADIIISRAGAMACAELCIVGKPVIFVPYPFAAEDHQTSNAMALVKKDSAICIKDDMLKYELMPRLFSLIHDKNLRNELGDNIKKLAIKNADEIIARIALQQSI